MVDMAAVEANNCAIRLEVGKANNALILRTLVVLVAADVFLIWYPVVCKLVLVAVLLFALGELLERESRKHVQVLAAPLFTLLLSFFLESHHHSFGLLPQSASGSNRRKVQQQNPQGHVPSSAHIRPCSTKHRDFKRQ